MWVGQRERCGRCVGTSFQCIDSRPFTGTICCRVLSAFWSSVFRHKLGALVAWVQFRQQAAHEIAAVRDGLERCWKIYLTFRAAELVLSGTANVLGCVWVMFYIHGFYAAEICIIFGCHLKWAARWGSRMVFNSGWTRDNLNCQIFSGWTQCGCWSLVSK